MAYFHGAYLQKDMEGLQEKINEENRKKHKERIRRRYQTVYRPVKTFKGRALTREELNEYMRNVKEFYAKQALKSDEFKLPESYHDNTLSKSKKKFGNKKTRDGQATYTVKADPEFLKNRIKRGLSGKILTNKRDLKSTLKFRKDNYFRGGKTRKRKRKYRRKTKRKRRRKRKTKKKKK